MPHVSLVLASRRQAEHSSCVKLHTATFAPLLATHAQHRVLPRVWLRCCRNLLMGDVLLPGRISTGWLPQAMAAKQWRERPVENAAVAQTSDLGENDDEVWVPNSSRPVILKERHVKSWCAGLLPVLRRPET